MSQGACGEQREEDNAIHNADVLIHINFALITIKLYHALLFPL